MKKLVFCLIPLLCLSMACESFAKQAKANGSPSNSLVEKEKELKIQLGLTPNRHKIRAELSLVQYRLEHYKESLKNIEILLEQSNVPTKVKNNLNQLKQSILRKAPVLQGLTKHHLVGLIEFSIGSDSNVSRQNYSGFDEDNYLGTDTSIIDPIQDDFYLQGEGSLLFPEEFSPEYDLLFDLCPESPNFDQPCDAFLDFLGEQGFDNIGDSDSDFIDEDGNIISIGDLDFPDLNFDDDFLFEEFDYRDSFHIEKINLRHLYRSYDYTWKNEVEVSHFTPFSLSEFDFSQYKLNSNFYYSFENGFSTSVRISFKNQDLFAEKNRRYLAVRPELGYRMGATRVSASFERTNLRTSYFFDEKLRFDIDTVNIGLTSVLLNKQLILSSVISKNRYKSKSNGTKTKSDVIQVSALYYPLDNAAIKLIYNHSKYSPDYEAKITFRTYKAELEYEFNPNLSGFLSVDKQSHNQNLFFQDNDKTSYRAGVKYRF